MFNSTQVNPRPTPKPGPTLARDGRGGNTLALPADQQSTVRQLLAKQPLLNSADLILPGTIPVEGQSR
ncbi:MAG: hypothetical protein OXE52_04425 [Chloroflexi bacterium]|nr:hypothetical protein [Chloroflexota bacterium]